MLSLFLLVTTGIITFGLYVAVLAENQGKKHDNTVAVFLTIFAANAIAFGALLDHKFGNNESSTVLEQNIEQKIELTCTQDGELWICKEK